LDLLSAVANLVLGQRQHTGGFGEMSFVRGPFFLQTGMVFANLFLKIQELPPFFVQVSGELGLLLF
jgi:hypothetical protein